MPKAKVNGVELYYEITGEGFPFIWCHELAGDYRSWNAQVEHFSQRYRVITFNAKGYAPSDIPNDVDAYTQEQQVEDLRGLMQELGIKQAIIGGLSMGGSVALNFGLSYPKMARALIIAGVGTGSTDPGPYRQQVEAFASELERNGMEALADYALGPTRVQYLRKDPEGFEVFNRRLASLSPTGCSLTLRGFPGRRPTIFELEPSLRELEVPTLIVCGDEDDPCIEPSLFMKRVIPRAGLAVFPRTGHTLNLEEPKLFNRTVEEFLLAVEAGNWDERNPGTGVGFLAATKR